MIKLCDVWKWHDQILCHATLGIHRIHIINFIDISVKRVGVAFKSAVNVV